MISGGVVTRHHTILQRGEQSVEGRGAHSRAPHRSLRTGGLPGLSRQASTSRRKSVTSKLGQDPLRGLKLRALAGRPQFGGHCGVAALVFCGTAYRRATTHGASVGCL